MSDHPTLYTNPDALAVAIGKQLLELGFTPRQDASLWTKTECAEYLRCTTIHIDMLIRQRGFPFIDISNPHSKSRDLRFSPAAVRVWESQQSTRK
jgi:hypothetical protein